MNKSRRIVSLILAFALLLSMGVYAAAPGEEGVRYDPSEGQKNIVLRARQLIELRWTPLADRTAWGWQGTFTAGKTYTGAPYGQPVYTGYIGYAVDIDGFIAATEDNQSAFYTGYSQYNKIAPYYSTDCSGFVSYAWGLKQRCFTGTLPTVSYKISDQSINALEIGDCMNNTYSHAALVTDVVRDAEGKVVSVEIMEQTPIITQTTRYGEGGKSSLLKFETNYFSRGYSIYRYYERDSVEYVHSCAVPLDGEWCENCRYAAPYAGVEIGDSEKTVSLSHGIEGGKIYYTLDGTDPAIGGIEYSGKFSVGSTAQIRAYAVFPDGNISRELKYKVSVEKAAAPTYSLHSGKQNGTELSVGSSISLASKSPGVSIYYTLDGSEPNTDSIRYTKPILISGDTTLKAIAVGGGYTKSDTAIFGFTLGKFAGFSDLVPDAWYTDAIEFVCGRGLFNGVSESTFAPSGNMTRGMFATVLGRMAGVSGSLDGRIGISLGEDVNVRNGPGVGYGIVGQVDKNDAFSVLGLENGWYKVSFDGVNGYIRADFVKPYEGAFADLDESKYYSPYVQWLWLTGISSGTGMGGFESEKNIDRESMAVLLYRYAAASGVTLPQTLPKENFSDDSSIGFRTEVYALQQAGVIKGMSNGCYEPDGGATRAQVATIFMNFALAVGG